MKNNNIIPQEIKVLPTIKQSNTSSGKFVKHYIKSNSDGGFPVGFNSVEVGSN